MQPFDQKERIFIAGHTGLVGSALMHRLRMAGYHHLITRTHSELNLTNQNAVNDFFRNETIDVVFLAAARVGGIHANNVYRADFIYQNLMIQCNVIDAAFRAGIERLLFLGSSCIYPRQCAQPMKEEHLLGGYLEPTNEPYAVAKIAGIKLCESYNRQHGTEYRAVMPTNLYGPGDNFDLENSHVLPAMLRKFHLAKLSMENDLDLIKADEERFGPIPEQIRNDLYRQTDESSHLNPAVTLWGSGKPRREFLHVDDMAAACLFVMQLSDEQYMNVCRSLEYKQNADYEFVPHINVGCGRDISIGDLAETINTVSGFKGDVIWDRSKPDGMLTKRLNISRLASAGWSPTIDLKRGIENTYGWYLRELKKAKSHIPPAKPEA